MQTLRINGQAREVAASADTPLLWVIRDELGLTGTKFGCGVAQCGACTVHLDGAATRSCVMPLAAVRGRQVRTVESLHEDRIGRALQQAWLARRVAQCGYCQSGMLMAAHALLAEFPVPTDRQIDDALTNVCRCGTYMLVKAGIHDASQALRGSAS